MKQLTRALSAGSLGVILTAFTTTEATRPPSPALHGPQVKLESGVLEGVRSETIEYFKGIPYAAPPVGQLRWAPPQPADHWPGIRSAANYGNDCAQSPFPFDASPLRTTSSENCLYANVWRPAGGGTKLPVMFWIHGGAYVNGGSSPAVYDGGQFARDGVILVSINYRLGRFGFFGFPALTAASKGSPLVNYGFMDQIAALKWVKANIAAFGGDPNNVTVVGESAGGYSVHTLLTSPLAAGLFSKAIVESGGGRSNLMGARQVSKDLPNLPSADTIGVTFAKANGIEGTDSVALAALRALPADKVVNGLTMMSMIARGGPVTYGGPVVDGKIVTNSPEQAYKSGQFNKVPLISGANSADIGFGMAKTIDEALAPFDPENLMKAQAAYDPDNTGNVPLVVMKVAMDRMMIEPARFAAGAFVARGIPSYEYRFSYVAPAAVATMAKNPMLTVMKNNKEFIDFMAKNAQHASEIPYVFETITAVYGPNTTQEDVAEAKAMHAYWVNFCKSGDPNVPGAVNPQWPLYDPQADILMDFTQDGPKAISDPLKLRMDLTAARKD